MTEEKPSSRILGIDLGTTQSAMAYLDEHGTPVTIPNAEGELTTPSVILLESNGDAIVGREARRAALVEPDRVVDCVKRDMGEESYHRAVAGRTLSPVHLSALILKKLRQDAEARIGPIRAAVITVPAYFDEGRRQATISAGEIAGLKVLDIINEPTSAALAYAFRDFVRRGGRPTDTGKVAVAVTAPHNAVVYDLGGGTLDVTVLRITGSDLTVLATDGEVQLGGRDWDERVMNYAADAFVSAHGQDPRLQQESYQELLQDAEEAKKDLSKRHRTKFTVHCYGKSLQVELERDHFEKITADLLFRTENRLTNALVEAGLTWNDTDEILATGGSTRMPQVMAMLRRVTGKEPNCSLSPDEVVAHGAAIYGVIRLFEMKMTREAQVWIRRRHKRSQTQVSAGAEAMAPAAQAADASPQAGDVGAQAEQDAQQPLLPEDDLFSHDFDLDDIAIDEQVASSLRKVKTTDVTAHSLGVVTTLHNGEKRVNVLIPRNSRLPSEITKHYGLTRDGQTRVDINVVEGESEFVGDCARIGHCQIDQLPPGLKERSPVAITFSYDASSCLHVRAVEVTSGKSATTTIHRESGMDRASVAEAREVVAGIRVI